ncbi:trehalose operon repressor [Ligilactobacillus equi]|uniref:Trehalose operon repressor n=2 Tax=Ligilactobacillus equi TaxID=137357 RepID=V7HU76_9LACO|nr:trehalose operon repressor [Ligilactobacillus equi]ETA73447.1 Trehalose operon transcriptional repressor [Ligilactobacillus equi DPC 6820]KRL80200.1 trehalose operon transcriptional repressor [Ligilactobacillus equi DSM 15833 = JCM 10991]MCQ2557003.1 trehalose operon repressor [Ligilactobacillus sp.]
MATLSKQEIIAQDIVQKIKFKQYNPGDYLPSEHRLCELYGTSRETVRKALAQLTSLGLIQKIRGKGSLVLDMQDFTFPISGIVDFKKRDQSLGHKGSIEVLNLESRIIPDDFSGHPLEEAGNSAYWTEYLRYKDDVPAVLNQEFLFKTFVPEIKTEDVSNLYKYLEEKLELVISYSTREITVEKAPADVCKILELTEGDYVAVIRSMSYLDNTSLFQLTTSYQRPDKFKFIDFDRRKNAARSKKNAE